jgi:hypothetical protein
MEVYRGSGENIHEATGIFLDYMEEIGAEPRGSGGIIREDGGSMGFQYQFNKTTFDFYCEGDCVLITTFPIDRGDILEARKLKGLLAKL